LSHFPAQELGVFFVLFCFEVSGLELRPFTLSHATSSIFVKTFSR
jgi:hypothetical protein